MGKCVDSLGDTGNITTVDSNWSHKNIEIAEQGKDKTAFSSHHGLRRFQGRPFHQKYAQSTYHLAMEAVLSSAKLEFALVFLEDVLICS